MFDQFIERPFLRRLKTKKSFQLIFEKSEICVENFVLAGAKESAKILLK